VSWLGGVRTRLRLLLGRRGAEARMEEEFRFHLEMQAEQYLREGLAPAEARRRARLAFGGVEGHRESMRDGRGGRWVEEVGQDVRFALRSLRRYPGFAAVAAVTIALGVGATTVVFSVLNAALLRPLPVSEAERLQVLWEERGGAVWQGVEGAGLPYTRFLAYRAATGSHFSGLAGHRLARFSLRSGEEAVAVQGTLTAGDYFGVLRLRPAAGRFPAADDEAAVVLAHDVWRARFGGDPGVVGRSVYLDSRPYTVVGVAPRGFGGTAPGVRTEVWVPLVAARAGAGLETMSSWVALFGRLRPGTDAAAAAALVEVVALRTPPDEPQTVVRGARLEPMSGALRGWSRSAGRTALLYLLGAATLVLLVAAANVAGMLLARGVVRRREVGIRLALGAGRGRLVRQLLTESGVLALAGGVGGVVVAAFGTRVLAALPLPAPQPLALDVAPDGRVLAFALAITMGAALVFGLVPALQATRPEVFPALRAGGAGAGADGPGRARARGVFVAGQVAAAVFLLVVAGLFLRSLQRTLAVELGYDPRGVVIASTELAPHGYDEARGRAFYDALRERIAALPGVESVAYARAPLAGGAREGNDMHATTPAGEVRREWGVAQNRVDAGFFEAVRLPVVAGRGFTPEDGPGAPGVTVVNETLARLLWPEADPLGQRVTTHGGELVVVGVVADGLYAFRNGRPAAYAFLPVAQRYAPDRTLHVRATGDAAQWIRRIRAEVRALDPNVAVADAQPLVAALGALVGMQRAAAALLAAFGALAVLLAGIGVYGVLAFHVARRTREFGIRSALGAPAGALVLRVLGSAAALAAVGAAVGLALGAAASVAIRGSLYGVGAADPVTFAAVAATLAAVAVAASIGPVRRALRVDPVVALRTE
jgi:predicted permease